MNYVEIRQLQYIIETNESDVNLKDGIKDSEVAKINIKEVDNASEECPEINVEDENIIDIEDIYSCVTNEEAMTEISTVKSKEDGGAFVDQVTKEKRNIREV